MNSLVNRYALGLPIQTLPKIVENTFLDQNTFFLVENTFLVHPNSGLVLTVSLATKQRNVQIEHQLTFCLPLVLKCTYVNVLIVPHVRKKVPTLHMWFFLPIPSYILIIIQVQYSYLYPSPFPTVSYTYSSQPCDFRRRRRPHVRNGLPI